MKKMITSLAIVLCFACTSEESKDTESKNAAPSQTPQEKMIGHMEKMAKIVDDNKEDCKKMTSDMEAYQKDNKDEMAELKKKMEEKSEDEQKKIQEKYGDRIEKASKTILVGAMKCAFSKSKDTESKNAAPDQTLEEKMIGHIEKMAKIVEDNKDDCKKMESEMEAYEKDQKDEMNELKKKMDKKSEDEQKKILEKYGDRIEKATQTILGGVVTCGFEK